MRPALIVFRQTRIVLLTLALALMPLTEAHATATRIVATVNESAITNTDVAARYGMMLLSAGLADTPDNRARIMPQTLRSLIDEQVQAQEVRRQAIEVTDKEVDAALARIATDNQVPGGDVRAFFQARGVPPETLIAQVRTGLGWGKLVQRQLRPRIDISDDEVDDIIARRHAGVGKTEFFINEVFLPVDAPEQDAPVRAFADRLLQQIKQTGAFGAIARQFSQGAGAGNGGEIGWVQQGTLAPDLDAALIKAKTGDLLGPLKSTRGYHIIAVRDRRAITMGGDTGTIVTLATIVHPITPRTLASLVETAKSAAASVKGCADLAKRFPESDGWRITYAPEQSVAALPPALAAAARSIPVGGVSAPDPTPGGLALLAVCARSERADADRDAIMNRIGNERLENLARGLLRDLKRSASIVVRS